MKPQLKRRLKYLQLRANYANEIIANQNMYVQVTPGRRRVINCHIENDALVVCDLYQDLLTFPVEGNRFFTGNDDEVFIFKNPICACGCGMEVVPTIRLDRPAKYINGHNIALRWGHPHGKPICQNPNQESASMSVSTTPCSSENKSPTSNSSSQNPAST